MPGKNGTGPMGQGSMTGRGLGPCSTDSGRQIYDYFGRGMGLGCRRGFGRGPRRGFGFLQNQLDLPNRRRADLRGEDDKE